MSRWSDATGSADGERYAARFDALAAAGQNVHGEASLCASLVPPAARVLDAGCGTGRVAIRLAELGRDCTGVDLDPSMLAVARRRSPEVCWQLADLATLDLLVAGTPAFDLVVAAGNVLPFLAAGTGQRVVGRLAHHLMPGGVLVAGFGLDRTHLPATAGLVRLQDYDSWCALAGLTLDHRLATWEGEEYAGGGYAVNIHRRSLP